MSHPIKIEGLSLKAGLGEGTKVHPQGKHSAPISKGQITQAIQQINQNVGNNPQPKPSRLPNNSSNQSEIQTNQTSLIKGNGNAYGLENGHGRGRGRGHRHGGEINPKPPTTENPQPLPDFNNPKPPQNNGLTENPVENNLLPKLPNQTNENPLPNQPKPTNTGQNTNNNSSFNENPVQNQTVNNNQSDFPINSHGKPNNWANNHGFEQRGDNRGQNFNRPDNFVHIIVIKQIFQDNDIHLNNRDIARIVNNQNQQTQNALPPELKNILQNINERTLTFLENAQKFTGKTANQIADELSRQFGEQIRTLKNSILQNPDLNAKPFSQTDIHERMHTAVDLMPKHLSDSEAAKLNKNSSQEVLNGFLLTRGLILADEKSSDVRHLIAAKPLLFPNEINLTALRDIGQLVKILIAGAAIAKNTANLDLAVQKFVRLLIANNEFGVLLATITLAREAGSPRVLVNRALALAKIYEMINRLVLAGEKAMTETAQTSNKSIWNIAEQKISAAKSEGLILENDDKNVFNLKNSATGAESALRQFLEFNPNSRFDNSTSAFFNSDDSRQARQDFTTVYHQDIENWLKSGNHRFVRDYEFEKPVGIVVERESDGWFNANKMRIILVRDGSVQGWHILKSILVK